MSPALRQLILTTRVGLSASDAKHVVRRLTSGPTWRSFVLQQRRLVTDAHALHRTCAGSTCPVVIVAGTRDDIATPRAVITLGRRLPGSEVITTDTGHLIPIDDPDAVASASPARVCVATPQAPSARPITATESRPAMDATTIPIQNLRLPAARIGRCCRPEWSTGPVACSHCRYGTPLEQWPRRPDSPAPPPSKSPPEAPNTCSPRSANSRAAQRSWARHCRYSKQRCPTRSLRPTDRR